VRFPSPEFDDAVAAACHGIADEQTLAALAELLQADDAALDEYLLRTELHSTLLTASHLVDPVDPGSILALATTASRPDVVTANDRREQRGARAAVWAGAAVLGLIVAAMLGSTSRSEKHNRPSDEQPTAIAPPVEQPRPAPQVVGTFGSIDSAEWVAADTIVREGDPLRSGRRIELASGSVRLYFASGAVVRLTGPAIFEAESSMTAVLTMGRVAVTADTPESKGFTIRTRTGRIVDLGTEFTAEALPDGRCRIGVSSGAVSFHPGERGAGHLLRAGDVMEVEPGQRQVITRIEQGDESPAFRFPSIEPPADDDFADRSRGQASIRSVLGRLYSNLPKAASADPEILFDGRGQTNPDAPEESLYFADDETGGLLIDLGESVPLTKINVYSWHRCMNPGFADDLRYAHRERAAQNFVLYAHTGTSISGQEADAGQGARAGQGALAWHETRVAQEPPSVDADPASSGWTLIARVNSDAYFGLKGPSRPAQQASSVSSARGTLGKYRYLLVVVQPTTGINNDGTPQNFGTFFGEIDVYAD